VELKEKTTPKAAPDKADTAAEKETATVEPDPAAPKAEEGGSQAASGGSGSAGGSGAGTSNASGGVTGSDNWDAGNENNFGGNSGSDNKRVWHEPWDEWVNEGHWETTTVHHDEEVYSNWPVYGAKCDCGYTTDVPNILYAHLDETGHRGYVTGVQIDTKTHVVPAWEEKVEVWIDTSHWIHHEGYWE
jgi:hypothetical protein